MTPASDASPQSFGGDCSRRLRFSHLASYISAARMANSSSVTLSSPSPGPPKRRAVASRPCSDLRSGFSAVLGGIRVGEDGSENVGPPCRVRRRRRADERTYRHLHRRAPPDRILTLAHRSHEANFPGVPDRTTLFDSELQCSFVHAGTPRQARQVGREESRQDTGAYRPRRGRD
jgi:hypothetical protein